MAQWRALPPKVGGPRTEVLVMPFSPSTSRPVHKAPSKRTAGFALVGTLVAIGVLGASAPAVAAALVPISSKYVLPGVELAELRAATAAAELAITDAGAANAELAAAGITVTTLTVNSQDLRTDIKNALDLNGAPARALAAKTAQVIRETDEVVVATANLRADIVATQERIAAEQAAAAQAAAEVAAAEAAAEAAAAANTPDGARSTAASIALNDYGWGSDQFSCLESLWNKESGWNFQAENPSSGAYGIPQSLPGNKMSTVADDWATNATTQIIWGLQYIDAVYGSPCGAWGHSQSTDWY